MCDGSKTDIPKNLCVYYDYRYIYKLYTYMSCEGRAEERCQDE